LASTNFVSFAKETAAHILTIGGDNTSPLATAHVFIVKYSAIHARIEGIVATRAARFALIAIATLFEILARLTGGNTKRRWRNFRRNFRCRTHWAFGALNNGRHFTRLSSWTAIVIHANQVDGTQVIACIALTARFAQITTFNANAELGTRRVANQSIKALGSRIGNVNVDSWYTAGLVQFTAVNFGTLYGSTGRWRNNFGRLDRSIGRWWRGNLGLGRHDGSIGRWRRGNLGLGRHDGSIGRWWRGNLRLGRHDGSIGRWWRGNLRLGRHDGSIGRWRRGNLGLGRHDGSRGGKHRDFRFTCDSGNTGISVFAAIIRAAHLTFGTITRHIRTTRTVLWYLRNSRVASALSFGAAATLGSFRATSALSFGAAATLGSFRATSALSFGAAATLGSFRATSALSFRAAAATLGSFRATSALSFRAAAATLGSFRATSALSFRAAATAGSFRATSALSFTLSTSSFGDVWRFRAGPRAH
jgi:hypothetical protein